MAKPRKDPKEILLRNVEADADILKRLNRGKKKAIK